MWRHRSGPPCVEVKKTVPNARSATKRLSAVFFFKQKTAYEIGLGIPAEPLFRSNRSRKARVSYKVQRTINASLNAATSTRAVSSNPNFVTRQKIEIIFG